MAVRTVSTISAVLVFAFAAVGAVILSVQALIGWGLAGLAVGTFVACGGVSPLAERLALDFPASGTRAGVRAAISAMALFLAVAGMGATVGPVAAVCLVVLLLAGAGWAAWRVHRGLGTVTGAAPAAPSVPAPVRSRPVVPVVELSVGELCVAWRRSYGELQRVTDEETRQEITRRRRDCLDELERRDPVGFARWLASGARAGSDPQRYMAAGG
jgi:hypothetical protein